MNEKYYLLDLERTITTGIVHYWKPNKHGYTNYIADAGRYKYEDAKQITESDFDRRTVMIPESVVDRLMRHI